MTKTGNAPGAAGQDFDDGDWASVRLPHDWAIQHPIEADQNNAWGYRRRGIGWYRRTLRLEKPGMAATWNCNWAAWPPMPRSGSTAFPWRTAFRLCAAEHRYHAVRPLWR
jgi:hypothetical protein